MDGQRKTVLISCMLRWFRNKTSSHLHAMNHHDSQKTFSHIRPGFTLTELLVVLLIIAILAALSLFGMKRMRSMADKAGSVRNISQLQIANMSYAADHNGDFVPLKDQQGNGPVTSRWFLNLEYLANLTGMSPAELERKKSTAIPLEMLDPKVVRARMPFYDRVYTSYGMNDTALMATTENAPRSHNLNKMSEPSRSMAFATATDYRVTYNSRYSWDFKNPKDEKTSNGEIAYRHGNKALVVYFDGHVGEMDKGDFQEIDKSGGINNIFWKPKQ
jgi:prepilin-type N-terminal cleavage/methylation domain-containing protein/prepilin-type processing-associated H-X9-DG protein